MLTCDELFERARFLVEKTASEAAQAGAEREPSGSVTREAAADPNDLDDLPF
jgi:hypothetical protein